MSRRQLNSAFVSGGVYHPRGRQLKPQTINAVTPETFVETPILGNRAQSNAIPVVTTAAASTPMVTEVPFPVQGATGDNGAAAASENDGEGKEFVGGKFSFKKIFLNRKKSSVRQKEKKIRQNRQLRKALLPKNALMALNEVRGITISDFIINSNPSGGFIAVVTVNNKQYEGRGNTKMFAKNSACEKALRDYVIEKMRLKPRLPCVLAAQSSNGQDHEDETMDVAPSENNDSVCDDGESTCEDGDDVPMINLASFAIFKLFTEWENEGFVIPELHPASCPAKNGGDDTAVKEPKPAPIRSELPPNWETLHPCTLLCMMRPGLAYTDSGPSGEKPNILQTVSIKTDDEEFSAQGRSKKIARRNAAVKVCNKLFGTNFNEDM